MKLVKVLMVSILLGSFLLSPADFKAQTADVRYTLTVQVSGNGSGIIVSSPPGIDCGGEFNNCSADFARGTPVTLSPRPLRGPSQFGGWSVAVGSTIRCPASFNECHFIVTENSSIQAQFIVD